MRVPFVLIQAAVLVVAPWSAAAQTPALLSPPVLGYVFDSSTNQVRMMAGVPGAASLTAGFAWAGGAVAVSPLNTFGLASGAGLSLLDWSGSPLAVRTIDKLEEVPVQIAFSPSGRTAAAYYRAAARLRVWTGLPERAALLTDLEVFPPDVDKFAMAVSDDGQTVAALVAGKLIRLDIGATVDGGASYAAIAFRPGSRDLAVADAANDRILLFTDMMTAGVAAPLAGADKGIAGPAALMFSRDGKRLVVANHSKESLWNMDLEKGTAAALDCACRPDGLYPAAGNAVFRLGESAKGNLSLYDGDSEEPRIVLVSAGVEGGAQ
jgi:hypothetical protein